MRSKIKLLLTLKALGRHPLPREVYRNMKKIKKILNLHLGSRKMTIFGEWASYTEPKFDKNAHNF